MIETPHLWIPKAKIIEPKDALTTGGHLQGWYKLTATKRDGRTRVLADWFPNIITTAGLNAIGAGSSWMNKCYVGTGNTTPAITDTTLVSIINTAGNATASGTLGAQGSAPYYGYTQTVYRFSEGTATGNIAEVGVGSVHTNLFSRALVVDGGGSPTTVTVLSDETLDVAYELRCYPPISDVVSTITITGVLYDYTIRAANVTGTTWAASVGGNLGGTAGANSVVSYSGVSSTIGAITSTPSGTTQPVSGINTGTYSNGDFFRNFTSTWGLTEANTAGGIGALRWRMGATGGAGGLGDMQMSFTPRIDKTSSKILTLNFRHSWARRP